MSASQRRPTEATPSVVVTNAQREARVNMPAVTRLVRRAIRMLEIKGRGIFAIVFVDLRRIRVLNQRFLRHDRATDVLSFRYDVERRGDETIARARRDEPPAHAQVVGEILIAPRQALAYARAHGVSYEQELARYVVHGLLHWTGREDRTRAQQRAMRGMEDRLLAACARNDRGSAAH